MIERNRKPKEIKFVINKFMDKIGCDDLIKYRIIKDKWVEIVGNSVAKNAIPYKIERNILIVKVKSSVWLSELERFHKKTIIESIKKHTKNKKLKNIKFIIG